MEYVGLPGTSLLASRVGFGCAPMGGYDYGPVDDAESVRAVHRALDIGITFFDVADVYGLGHAERVLGRALDGRRGEAVIATKGGVRWDASGVQGRTLDPAWIAGAIDASLERLGTDCIDLYQLHWPVDGARIDAAAEVLERARCAGKIRVVGCCNFSPSESEHLASRSALATEQLPYNLIDRAKEPVLAAAAAAGRLTLTYNSLAQGLFASNAPRDRSFEGSDLRARGGYFRDARLESFLPSLERLATVARARGRTPTQVALRWALDQPFVGVVLTGIKRPWQVEQNAAAADWRLTADERAFLDAAITTPT